MTWTTEQLEISADKEHGFDSLASHMTDKYMCVCGKSMRHCSLEESGNREDSDHE